jgi:RNA-directed DNA polymerase
MLFQYKSDAEAMYQVLPKRMGKFGLELAMDKTKMMEFGRFAKQNSKGGKTETFDFLGFTFCNGTARNGKYRVHIQTSKKKLEMKRQAMKTWLNERMREPVATTLESLNRKLQGHVNYYGINGNIKMLANFFNYAKATFIRVLRARGQKHPIKWKDFQRIWDYYIKPPKIAVNIWV